MASNGDKPSTTNIVECASCKSLGQTEKAVKYCLNCMECMCQQCLDISHRPKPMGRHEFSDIGNMCDKRTDDLDLLKKISTLVACPSHPNETVRFHCLGHDTFCCTICVVADHRKCSVVIEIEKHMLEEDFKDECTSIKRSASAAIQFANAAKAQMKSYIEAHKKQATSIAKHFAGIKSKINQILDESERILNGQVQALTERERKKIQDKIKQVGSGVESFEVHSVLMEKAIETGSTSHQYIAQIRCREKLKQFEFFLEEMTGNFESVRVSYRQTKLLDELLNIGLSETEKLCSVTESPYKPLHPKYDYAVNKLNRYTFYKIGMKQVKENYPWYSSSSVFLTDSSSLVFLPNNHLALLDSNNDSDHCLLASEDGKVLSSCSFKQNTRFLLEVLLGAPHTIPYCITVTKPDDVIAVSLPEQKKIGFVSTNDGQIKVTDKVIQTKHKPGAIFGLKFGDIAVAWREPVAFGIIDNNTARADTEDKVYFCKDTAGRRLKSFEYMAIDEERSHVIQPCTRDRAVYCFDFNGNPKFKYTNPELRCPQGVAVDRDGNIYVCDYETDCIHVISPTGSASRLIKDECPFTPLAIAFNKDGDRFAVTQGMTDSLITFFRVQIENS